MCSVCVPIIAYNSNLHRWRKTVCLCVGLRSENSRILPVGANTCATRVLEALTLQFN